MSWKHTAGQRIAKLSQEQARGYLERIRLAGVTINQPAIRELTGGYACQSINYIVIRKLAAQAGMISKEAGNG